MTGIETACFTDATISQSDFPENAWLYDLTEFVGDGEDRVGRSRTPREFTRGWHELLHKVRRGIGGAGMGTAGKGAKLYNCDLQGPWMNLGPPAEGASPAPVDARGFHPGVA